MSLPYLPLYIDDYEADTAHLSLLEDGIYNRLLRLSWRTPGCKLPDDEAWIFRKLRAVTDAEKQAVRDIIDEFFKRGRGKIFSPRLVEVHVQVSVSHQRRKEAGKAGGVAKSRKKLANGASNALALPKQPEPEPEPIREDSEANASGDFAADPVKAVFDAGVRVITGCGVSEQKARAFIGRLRKDFPHQDGEILSAIMDCGRAGAVDPIPWIQARLHPKAPARLYDISKIEAIQ